MKYRVLLAATTLAASASASADPAMSVVTVNTQNPMAYMEWAMSSGPAIAEAIDAEIAGVCLATAGFYGPGEIYYWHIFEDHAHAMSASIYDEAVAAETAKLATPRQVGAANLYGVAMASAGSLERGDTFASWNLSVGTDEPALYLQQLHRILAAAAANGYDDINVNAYSALTGPAAGDMLVAVSAPDSERLGEFIDELNSPWMGPIIGSLAAIRDYQNAVAMQCTVVYADD